MPMRVAVIRPGELGPVEIAAWRSIQRASPSLANPFLSPEFTMAVGRFRPEARVAVLTEGQAVVGFFAFERRALGLGVPIGGWLSGCQGLVHVAEAEWDPRELLHGCGLAAWQFDNLIADQQPFKPYQAATRPSPIIDLADGFEAYYAKVMVNSRHFCRELARKTRKLGREAGEVRIVADSRDSDLLRALMAWKSEQYRRTRHVDRFERPWVGDLLEALLAVRSEHVDGLLSVLYADDQPVAAQFGLRAGNLLAGLFTGYDIRFAKYSPGMIHLIEMAEQLASAGITAVYMGKGARRYTETIKSCDVFVGEGVVTGRSILGAVHRVRGASAQWALRAVRQRPGLHRAADRMLRRSGVSRRTYGRL
jgi:CelD/BcsL family acetyltransferase involved in cellulose biosynthesis